MGYMHVKNCQSKLFLSDLKKFVRKRSKVIFLAKPNMKYSEHTTVDIAVYRSEKYNF